MAFFISNLDNYDNEPISGKIFLFYVANIPFYLGSLYDSIRPLVIFLLDTRYFTSFSFFVFPQIETERLFSNIQDIHALHCRFWNEHLRHVLEASAPTGALLDPLRLTDAFEAFPHLFAPYRKYCLDMQPCYTYMRDRCKSNELFHTFVQWAESHPGSNRQRLGDLLVTPMQRLTKYSLLLNAVLKKTTNESAQKQIKSMVETVDEFVKRVNASLQTELRV